MRYLRADIQKVGRSEWLGFIHDLEEFFTGTTEYLARETAHRIIEETTGLNEFQIIWNRC